MNTKTTTTILLISFFITCFMVEDSQQILQILTKRGMNKDHFRSQQSEIYMKGKETDTIKLQQNEEIKVIQICNDKFLKSQ
ncbi:hypothetical protein AWC38_SpisGene16548 [Stylophora pistillata]|uniref:Uncharacterized protein n=1 Tax=Stylophora pistillata TaxID=50429 RepID=A0A2B4RQI1_STYPI|nr:hypothetical protein AWC38_SpisGene16548 [Stylophora pistillata]